MADLVSVIEKVKATLEETKQKISDNEGWDKGDFKDVYEAFVSIVATVEEASDELGGLTEAEKKECVSKTLNWMVDVPWVPEGLEGKMFDLVVGIIWEAAQERLGHEFRT